MFGSDLWGMEIRDVGYLHARSGAAQALLLWVTAGARARWRSPSSLTRARSEAGERSGSHCAWSAWREAGPRGSACLRNPPMSCARPRPCWSGPSPWRSWVPRCGGPGSGWPPGPRWPRHLTWRSAAAPARWRAARAELITAGGRPRRERRHGVDALTPSERRVARLAADGRTNRQIAQSLYVTLKTVETHLAHAYAKLGISQRSELPGALAGENLGVHARMRTPDG